MAARVTQVVVQVIGKVDPLVRVSQYTAEAVTQENPLPARVTQFVLEIVRSANHVINFAGTYTPTGDLTIELVPGTRDEFLDRSISKKIYLVELTLRYVSGGSVLTEKLYLSNHAFNTRAGETPENTEYIAVLQDEGLPGYTQEISEISFGISIPDYGSLTINNADAQFDAKLPPLREWEGGECVVKLTGDRQEFAFENAFTLLTGVMGKIRYRDNEIIVEILSKHEQLRQRRLPTETETGPNEDEIIILPVAYGKIQNASPILLTEDDGAGNSVWILAGREIFAVNAVYDDGVEVTSNATFDLPNGQMSYTTSAAGRLTVDFQGHLVNSGVYSDNRAYFIQDMLITYGGLTAGDIDTVAFDVFLNDVAGTSQFWVLNETDVLSAIQELLRPVLGYLYFSREGKAVLGTFKLPSENPAVVLKLSPHQLIGLNGPTSDRSASGNVVETRSVDLLIYQSVLLYSQNWTVQDESSLGAAAPVDPSTDAGKARRAFLAVEWRRTENTLTGATEGRNLYPNAEEMDPIPSYFNGKTEADTWATRWLTVFGVSNRIVRYQTKGQPFNTILHSIHQLSYRWYSEENLRILKLREDYGDNLVETEGFGET
jgi:hypothetical protein